MRRRRRKLAAWAGWALGTAASFLTLGSGPSYGISAVIGLAMAGLFRLSEQKAHGVELRAELARRYKERQYPRPQTPDPSPDPLTGLLTRVDFERAFRATKGANAVVLFDVDRLELVNRELGRDGGDVALRRLAGLLQEQGRDSDLFGRLQGGLFAVALLGCDEPGAWAYAERVGRRLLTRTEGDRLPLSVSAGVAAQDGDADPMELLARAERALHAAKDAGRARSAVWRPSPLLGLPGHGLEPEAYAAASTA